MYPSKRCASSDVEQSEQAAAPATPPAGECPGSRRVSPSTPSKSFKRRVRMRQTAILRSVELGAEAQKLQYTKSFHDEEHQQVLMFPGSIGQRLDRIEHLVQHVFWSMHAPPPMESFWAPVSSSPEATSFNVDADLFAPGDHMEPAISNPGVIPAASHGTAGPLPKVAGASSVETDATKSACQEPASPQADSKYEGQHGWEPLSSESDDERGEEFEAGRNDDNMVIQAPADGETFENIVAEMYSLCAEDDALGKYRRMSPSDKERSRAIRGELWDLFEKLALQRGIRATPESLSSSAGCLPTIYSDEEPTLESFQDIVEKELSMM